MGSGARLTGASSTSVVGSNLTSASTTTLPAVSRGELQLQLGTVVFPAFGNNHARKLIRTTGFQQGILSLTGGTVAVSFDGGDTPQVGDSYDLVDGQLAGELSTLTLAALSSDGNYNVTWDTTQWTSSGILTISDLQVLIVPEPGVSWLLGLGGLWLARRKRTG